MLYTSEQSDDSVSIYYISTPGYSPKADNTAQSFVP